MLGKALAEGEAEKTVGEIVGAFLRHPHLPIPASGAVVLQAIREGVREGVWGLRVDEEMYYRQESPAVDAEAVLVREVALSAPEAVVAPSAAPVRRGLPG